MMKLTQVARFFLFLVLLLVFTDVSAQSVKTLDGVDMGSRKEFINTCMKSYMQATDNSRKAKDEARKYCSCVCDSLFIRLHSDDIMEAYQNNSIAELLGTNENIELITRCMEGNLTIKDDYTFGEDESEVVALQKKVAVKSCVDELLKDTTMSAQFSELAANNYCRCAVDKMYARGTTYKELQDIENENSGAYNEILMPCIELLLDQELDYVSDDSAATPDVTGEADFTTVPLVDIGGKSFRVSLKIGELSRYFLFDTGASDLIISNELERELLLNGTLRKEHYLGKATYKLANNETVEGQKIIIPEIVIGDYVVRNTVAGVIENGSLLCGRSFLDKFSKHEIDSRKKELKLYK